MSRSENGSTISDKNHQRLCHIVKRDDFDGYGFNLHSEKGKPGQYIGKVDDNSPAELAGLRHGDRIIEVNGVNIGSETHKQVVQRIKAITNEVRLLVIDPNLEKQKSINNGKTGNDTSMQTTAASTTTTSSMTSTITVQSSTVVHDETNKIDDDNNSEKLKTSTPTSSHKNDTVVDNFNNSGTNINNNIINKTDTNNKISDIDTIPQSSAGVQSHQNGTTSTAQKSSMTTTTTSPLPTTGLNLPMTAAEMRAKLLAKKKYDPKNDSVDLRKKFEIIQKL